ncbi:DUF6641 family protein, partial [Novosphingobium sp. AAP93]|uniref:DUF6641 family protein n=1 Tax=Novosphingobium sp. AAP93 TaxID=1523427 RepID=UPI000AB3E44F
IWWHNPIETASGKPGTLQNAIMSSLAKLTIKPVTRQTKLSPIEARRNKLLTAIDEQLQVADAAMRGEEYAVTLSRWSKNDAGEKVRVQRQKVVRSWFFAQDGGFYVQCKYGSKAIALSKDGNAVFVKQLADVKPVLETLRSATANGELDAYVAMAINTRKNRDKLAS